MGLTQSETWFPREFRKRGSKGTYCHLFRFCLLDSWIFRGAVVSPLLASVYLHYTFDLRADVWRRKVAKRNVIIVRYATIWRLASS